MNKIFLLLIFFFVFVSLSSNVFAQEYSLNGIKAEKTYPDSQLAYNTKRLKEKIVLFFKFTPKKKVSYYKVLLNSRLSEYKYIVDSKNIAYIEKVSQRYETTAGQLTELIIEKNMKEEINSTIELLNSHKLIIGGMKDDFLFDSLEWRLLMNGLNSLEIYLEKLSIF